MEPDQLQYDHSTPSVISHYYPQPLSHSHEQKLGMHLKNVITANFMNLTCTGLDRCQIIKYSD